MILTIKCIIMSLLVAEIPIINVFIRMVLLPLTIMIIVVNNKNNDDTVKITFIYNNKIQY